MWVYVAFTSIIHLTGIIFGDNDVDYYVLMSDSLGVQVIYSQINTLLL